MHIQFSKEITDTRGVPKIMSFVFYFAEIVPYVHKKHLVSIEWSLKRNTCKYLAHTFAGLDTVYIALKPIHYTIHKFTGKRAENVLEISTYLKNKSLLGMKPVDIYREVCDIYREGQTSHMPFCRRLAKFRTGQQQPKDAARTGLPAKTT